MYAQIADQLAAGNVIILDGGTGTDIQRRGVPMSGETWCAEANLSHPQVVQAVHEGYIEAGAQIITANTFATSALLFNALGRDEDLLAIDRAAVAIAKRAAQSRPGVAVAGSISTMRPVIAGSDRTDLSRQWTEMEARDLFRRKAAGLAATGVDLIMMEMVRDGDYGIWATAAALETGLPVWVGISAERRPDGQLVGFGRHDWLLEDIVQRAVALQPAVLCIMHTSANITGEALQIVRRHWQGPLGAYPDSGFFKMPDWQFIDIIPSEELGAKCREWQQQGATIFGGCCGIGAGHIRHLHSLLQP